MAFRVEEVDGEPAVFSHTLVKRSATRDLVQVNLLAQATGARLVVIGNHWPSRRGGPEASAPYRMMAGETLAYFHERIREVCGTDTAIIAMGDFNDEPFDRSISTYANAERERARVMNARSAKFLNVSWPHVSAGSATYYYANEPNVL